MLTLRRISLVAVAACVVAAATAPAASATLRSPRLISSCPSGSTYQEQTRGPFRLEGCLVSEATRFITAPGTDKAELSGFDISLVGTEQIALMKTGDPRIRSIAGGKGSTLQIRVKGGPVDTVIHSGSLDLTATSGFEFDLADIPATAKLLGLDLDGDSTDSIHYSMDASGTTMDVNLQFPALLGTTSFAANLGVVDGTGLQLNSVDIGAGQGTVPFSPAPGVFLKDVQFKFTAPSSLSIGGKLIMPGVIPQSFAGTLVLDSAGFKSFSGSVSGANLPIAPPAPFFLQGGSVNVSNNPLSFGGSITTSFGQIDELTNSFIAKSVGSFQFTSGTPSKLKLTGTTSLFGIGNLSPANGSNSVTLSSDGVLSLNSTNSLDLRQSGVGGLSGTANVDGSFSAGGFQVSGSMSGGFDAFGITLASATGSFKANGKGYGACLTGSFLGVSATGQARADWPDNPSLDLGCNLDRFKNRSLGRSVSRAVPSGGSFSVPAGATNAAVRVRGTGAAPGFDLRLPDGTVLQVRDPKPAAAAVGGRAVFRATAADTTTIYLAAPPAGTWTVEDGAGQPLADVQVATDAPPTVSATVTGDGESRTLNWTAGDLDGGKLQLADVQADGTRTVLVDTTARTGKLDFKVPFGPAGARRIVAAVTGADGIPRAEMQVGSYTADKPFVPAPPRDVGISYSRKTRQLTFSQVQPTDPDRRPDFWYYKVRLADGRLLYFQGTGSQKVRVKGVDDNTPFTVSVFGIENEGLQGKARVEKGQA